MTRGSNGRLSFRPSPNARSIPLGETISAGIRVPCRQLLVGCRSADQRRQVLVAQTGHGPSRSRNEPSGYSGGRASSRRAGRQERYDRLVSDDRPNRHPPGHPADERPAGVDCGRPRERQCVARPTASRQCGWKRTVEQGMAADARTDEARQSCRSNADGVFGRLRAWRCWSYSSANEPDPGTGRGSVRLDRSAGHRLRWCRCSCGSDSRVADRSPRSGTLQSRCSVNRASRAPFGLPCGPRRCVRSHGCGHAS